MLILAWLAEWGATRLREWALRPDGPFRVVATRLSGAPSFGADLAALRAAPSPLAVASLREPEATRALLRREAPAHCDAVMRAAERVLAGEITLLGARWSGRPPDWHLDPPSGTRWDPAAPGRSMLAAPPVPGADPKLPWELARFQFALPLVQAFFLERDPRHARGVPRSRRRLPRPERLPAGRELDGGDGRRATGVLLDACALAPAFVARSRRCALAPLAGLPSRPSPLRALVSRVGPPLSRQPLSRERDRARSDRHRRSRHRLATRRGPAGPAPRARGTSANARGRRRLGGIDRVPPLRRGDVPRRRALRTRAGRRVRCCGPEPARLSRRAVPNRRHDSSDRRR